MYLYFWGRMERVFAKRAENGSVNSVFMRFSMTIFPGRVSDLRFRGGGSRSPLKALGGGSDSPPIPIYVKPLVTPAF